MHVAQCRSPSSVHLTFVKGALSKTNVRRNVRVSQEWTVSLLCPTRVWCPWALQGKQCDISKTHPVAKDILQRHYDGASKSGCHVTDGRLEGGCTLLRWCVAAKSMIHIAHNHQDFSGKKVAGKEAAEKKEIASLAGVKTRA
jgi:hypothetical protein